VTTIEVGVVDTEYVAMEVNVPLLLFKLSD
jgi:hypothetical protein